MLATVPAAVLLGVDGLPVTVEVHAGPGLPSFTIVGLPDASCREARDRVRAAINSSGLRWPNQRITVNLAPSGHRKVGAGLDLAIALGLLTVSGQIPPEAVDGAGFLGELGLDGTIRPVSGTLCLVEAITEPAVVVPCASAHEASVLGNHLVRAAGSLRELVDALCGEAPWPTPAPPPRAADPPPTPELADVRGHVLGRRAAEVAAAGGHHLLMTGPPGAGKTMLAERVAGLLPDLTPGEALEVARVHSAAAQQHPAGTLSRRPPFRAPHHNASVVAVVGGGTHQLRPGEVSLAHHGVLFLDEFAEFPAGVIDALRTPLEEGVVRIARAEARATLPARFLLVAAMNPCPCGAAGGPGSCRCTPAASARYRRRLSGPLLDRFDLRVNLEPPSSADLLGSARGETTAAVAARVEAAREIAATRAVRANAELQPASLDELAPLSCDAREMLERAVRAGRLSGRGVRRVRTVALTLADLAGRRPPVRAEHVAEAMVLRGQHPAGSRSVA